MRFWGFLAFLGRLLLSRGKCRAGCRGRSTCGPRPSRPRQRPPHFPNSVAVVAQVAFAAYVGMVLGESVDAGSTYRTVSGGFPSGPLDIMSGTRDLHSRYWRLLCRQLRRFQCTGAGCQTCEGRNWVMLPRPTDPMWPRSSGSGQVPSREPHPSSSRRNADR